MDCPDNPPLTFTPPPAPPELPYSELGALSAALNGSGQGAK
ncbi:hypothetical protein [Streptomyces sp. NPDC056049]